MNKLKLRLDDLLVDTFQTAPSAKEKGTVFGEQCTCYTQCTCPGCPTCEESCGGTCDIECFTMEGNTCVGRTCNNEPYWSNGQWLYC